MEENFIYCPAVYGTVDSCGSYSHTHVTMWSATLVSSTIITAMYISRIYVMILVKSRKLYVNYKA